MQCKVTKASAVGFQRTARKPRYISFSSAESFPYSLE
jgi:hypothetical protein